MNNLEFIKKCNKTELAKLLVEYAEMFCKESVNDTYVQKLIKAESFLNNEVDKKRSKNYGN